LGLTSAASVAEAKSVRFPRGEIRVNQLHQEILDRFPALKGELQADGSRQDPRLKLSYTPSEIILEVPEEMDEWALQDLVARHVPDPMWGIDSDPRQTARPKLQALGFTDPEIDSLLQ
jgi:hypothetical protein